jgi:hypothetical protein
MATYKNVSGDYVIKTPLDTNSNITLSTDNVYIVGNLTVRGNTTTVSSNNLTITDNIIVLNQGETAAGITKGNAGIIIDRGSVPYAQLQFSQTAGNVWQVTTDASSGWSNILLSGTAFELVQDPNPVMDGNLHTNGYTIYANVTTGTYITLQGALELKNANVAPNVAVGSTVFYANIAGAGQAGLYVTNDQITDEELVTKRRAFGFSLLL